jgi:RNA polymerase sigma-70 factor (ECF subfamily)
LDPLAIHEKPDPQGTLPEAGRLPPPPAGVPARPDHDSQNGLAEDSPEHIAQLHALRRAQEGDEDAFRWLLEANERRVYGLVKRMLGCDLHTAADISQEVFLRAFRAIKTFDGRALFSTWIHKITMNLCITEYRKRKALKRDRPTYSIDAPVRGHDNLRAEPPSHEVDPSDRLHHKDIASAVQAAIERLPEEFRECVLLRDMQGLSYEEICDVLDLVPGTVRSRIHRGRLILQRMLREFTP